MIGKMELKRDYNVKTRRMEERIENSFFQDRFGRNKFERIDGTALTLGTAVSYIIKYIEKTGGKIICSKGLRTFIETDIDNDDVVARLREGKTTIKNTSCSTISRCIKTAKSWAQYRPAFYRTRKR